ncbi:hypothetical protein V1507DRAFT_452215 [Lipomyces tetrasporus]
MNNNSSNAQYNGWQSYLICLCFLMCLHCRVLASDVSASWQEWLHLLRALSTEGLEIRTLRQLRHVCRKVVQGGFFWIPVAQYALGTNLKSGDRSAWTFHIRRCDFDPTAYNL